jgi:hypothetical protein
MKRHYIYFALLPVLLFLVFCLPFTIRTYFTVEHINNSFDDGMTWIIYAVPTVIATVLLLIRNRVTALIGASFYLLNFGLSIFMNAVLGNSFEKAGIGARLILVVMLAGVVLGTIQTVKLFRGKELQTPYSGDVLDDVF